MQRINVMKRSATNGNPHSRKQRMFIYILAFVAMTSTLGMFILGNDANEYPTDYPTQIDVPAPTLPPQEDTLYDIDYDDELGASAY